MFPAWGRSGQGSAREPPAGTRAGMRHALNLTARPPLFWRRIVVITVPALVGGLLLGCADGIGLDWLLGHVHDHRGSFLSMGAALRSCDGVSPFALALLVMGGALWPRGRPWRFAVLALGACAILFLPLAVETLFGSSVRVSPALLALCVAAVMHSVSPLDDREVDEQAGLGDIEALERAAGTVGDINVVAARIGGLADYAALMGPAAAANLLKRIAERLQTIQPHRALYRADDSTLVWIETPGDEQSLDDRLDHLAEALHEPLDTENRANISLNFGLAAGDRAAARALVAHAALAALEAAQKGIRWERYHGAETPRWRLALPRELDMAMVSGQIWNAYQPQLDIGDDRIVGAEVLVRWLHPLRGPIPPANFIPPLEAGGRARDLTAHVLMQALDDAVAWERAGHPVGIAINVSQSLLADHEFIELVGQILQGSPLPARRVTIEISERAAMSSPDRAVAALSSWRSHGLRIAIDNYGTGQASNPYLERFPATELKIDRSLVQALAPGSRTEKIVEAAIALAHDRGMKAVAEGVESAACLKLLGAMGCDVAQGFFIGRPMPGNALAEFLGEQSRAVA